MLRLIKVNDKYNLFESVEENPEKNLFFLTDKEDIIIDYSSKLSEMEKLMKGDE